MSAVELFWTSFPVRTAVRAIARLFPTWFHETTWQWGSEEAAVRNELLAKAARYANARVLKKAIWHTHDLVLTLLNGRYGGMTLEEHVPSMSNHSFSRIYTLMLVLICFRTGTRVDGFREDLAAICGRPDLVEQSWRILAEQGDDKREQFRLIWDECVQVLRVDAASSPGFFLGIFVMLINRAADDLKASESRILNSIPANHTSQ